MFVDEVAYTCLGGMQSVDGWTQQLLDRRE